MLRVAALATLATFSALSSLKVSAMVVIMVIVVIVMIIIIMIVATALIIMMVVVVVLVVSVAEAAVLACHFDTWEEVKGRVRVLARERRGDVAGQSEFLHKLLTFSKGASGHWRWSAKLNLAEVRATAIVNAVLISKIALLGSSSNAVTALSLA